MSASLIYKIVSEPAWDLARQHGAFHGAAIDREDGYIHFSTAAQVEETARKHFAEKTDLLLVAVDTAKLKPGALKWEVSRGGALFPHLYAELELSAVRFAVPLPWNGARHIFPALQ